MPASAEYAASGSTTRSLDALAHVLEALAGRSLSVQWLTDDPGSSATSRPILRADAVLLPPSGSPDQHLAAIAHAAAHLLFSRPAQATGKLKPMGIAMASAIEDARVEHLLIKRYPGLRALLLQQARIACQQAQGPDGSFADLVARLNLALLDPSYATDDYWVSKGRQLFNAHESSLDDHATLRNVASVLANDLGQMRVRMNLQGYAVPCRHGDDNSYLWQYEHTSEHSLASVDTAPTRAGTPAGAGDTTPQAQELARYSYPEWDYRLDRHRQRWTTVIERAFVAPAMRAPRVSIRPTALDHRVRLRRQWEGEDIDLDAATELMIDRRTGSLGDARIHRRSGRSPRHHSLLLLLDLSTSANDVVDGRTVLSLECQAALALVAAARANRDRVAVHGFSSNTREQVDYWRLSEFGSAEPAALELSLASVRACHSTRIGAAIRHAAANLSTEHHGSRHLVLLSDGEASDVDVFDTNYLREDAAAAVREARRAGIHVFCLALDSQAGPALGRIFGHGNTRSVLRPSALPLALRQLHEQLGRA
ncbi:VWA domain-containing protein [Azoarcus sp. L1K30]|uniref:nitric oxide reductase activation protein NorD n=1 Tax=Azoarcus sp. L1K30 TaxID=2820277 RepID=UPI001B83E41A|nr:VWA domain-containing protein [Azoarcus sp. L1K30]MBR0567270.1 VWA domain-containing protein [Azoarcus sp. L1K30]